MSKFNKWSTVHHLHSHDEPLSAENCIAKFLSDGLAQEFAEEMNKKPFMSIVAVKRTWGSVYVLPKPH